jgi:hypothetical protein
MKQFDPQQWHIYHDGMHWVASHPDLDCSGLFFDERPDPNDCTEVCLRRETAS